MEEEKIELNTKVNTKTKIAVLGIGGVGGYFGGKLAAKYAGSDEYEIIFFARGENEKAIGKKGLRLIMPGSEIVAVPDVVTNNPEGIKKVDYLVCCVKSYHLEESLKALKSCVGSNTVVLPFLNGVDARERIKKIYPNTEVWEGCAYIMTRLIEPGIVEEIGNIHQFHFGSDNGSKGKLNSFEQILIEAEFETYLSGDISQTMWNKFIMLSSIASLTSYLNFTIREIFADKSHKQTLAALMREVKSLGEAKQIGFPDNVIQKSLSMLESTPVGTTSSMHSDFKRGGETEYKSLTEYVAVQGKLLNVPTPQYDEISNELSKQSNLERRD